MLLSLCKQIYSLNNTNIFSTCAKFYRCVSKIEMNYAFFKFEWNIVLIMFKSHIFLNGAVLHKRLLRLFRWLRNTPLEKHMLLRHRLLRLQTAYRTVVHAIIEILELFLDIFLFRKKILKTTIYRLWLVICRLPVT